MMKIVISGFRKKSYLEKVLNLMEKKGDDIFSLDSFSYTQKELPSGHYTLKQYILGDFKGKGKEEVRDLVLKLPKEKGGVTVICIPKKLKKLFGTKRLKIENLNKTHKTKFKIIWK